MIEPTNASLSQIAYSASKALMQGGQCIRKMPANSELQASRPLTNDSPEKRVNLATLPPEVLGIIMRYLDEPALNCIRLMSHYLNEMRKGIAVERITLINMEEFKQAIDVFQERKIRTLIFRDSYILEDGSRTLITMEWKNRYLPKLPASSSIRHLVLHSHYSYITDAGPDTVVGPEPLPSLPTPENSGAEGDRNMTIQGYVIHYFKLIWNGLISYLKPIFTWDSLISILKFCFLTFIEILGILQYVI